MNRRDFLVRSSLFAGAGLIVRPLLGQSPAPGSNPPASPVSKPAMSSAPAPSATEFKLLRRDVGIFTGRGGTIGWLVNKDGVVVVDTQFPDTAAICLAGLPGRAGRKVDVVINTHHHGDHTGGNPIFKPAAKTIVAQTNAPKFQAAAAEKAGTVPDQVYADTTFDETWTHQVGDEIVSAHYHGPAHTGGDIIVHFERANVVHMGDIVFNRIYPAIDRVGGARVQGWISVLEDAARNYPADAIYVFGHGNPKFGVTGTRGDLLTLRDYLTAMLQYTRTGIAAGKTKPEIMALDNLPGFPDFHVAPPAVTRLPQNLGVAYDELTEKKG